jgi:hypothetical protein
MQRAFGLCLPVPARRLRSSGGRLLSRGLTCTSGNVHGSLCGWALHRAREYGSDWMSGNMLAICVVGLCVSVLPGECESSSWNFGRFVCLACVSFSSEFYGIVEPIIERIAGKWKLSSCNLHPGPYIPSITMKSSVARVAVARHMQCAAAVSIRVSEQGQCSITNIGTN